MDLASTWFMWNQADPMHVALQAYLSDMPESDKIAAVVAAFGSLPEIVSEMADAQVGDLTHVFGA